MELYFYYLLFFSKSLAQWKEFRMKNYTHTKQISIFFVLIALTYILIGSLFGRVVPWGSLLSVTYKHWVQACHFHGLTLNSLDHHTHPKIILYNITKQVEK